QLLRFFPQDSLSSKIMTGHWVMEWYPQFALVISMGTTRASAGLGTQCDPYGGGTGRGGMRRSGSVECSATLSPEPRPAYGTDRDCGTGEHVGGAISSKRFARDGRL